MPIQFVRVLGFSALLAACVPGAAAAQSSPGDQTPSPAANQGQPPQNSAVAPSAQSQPRTSTTPCGNPFEEPEPAKLPPTNGGPVTFIFELCFNKQGGSPTVDAETYTYYLTFDEETEKSNPPANNTSGQWDGWRPYNEASEQMIRDDFRRVWDQGLLDDLSIEATDYTFSNGAIGKIVTYHMEERDRVKIVTYDGSKQIDRTKIEEQLRDRSLVIAADSLLDERKIRLVEGVVREMMVEKGFNPEVSHTIEPIKNSPKTVNITFHISEGPKVKIRKVDFIGNKAFSDGKLQKQLKENKPVGMISFITGTGTFNAAKFEEDADKVSDYYMNRGYAGVRVGQPELKELETTKNGKTKWIEVGIPITEGKKYVFGELDFEGNSRVRSEFLRTLYKVKPGEIYSRKQIIDGNNKAREVYGEVGFMEFTPFPELKASDDPSRPEATLEALVPEGLTVPASPASRETAKPPHMDVTIRVTEGEQFFVNRIVFTGNTTTRDNVIRRELGRLVESAPFDSQALKTSIRRLNQLGYFKPLEGNDKDMKVDKTPGQTNMVDVTLKLEEQNRNQLTFGAGVSQYEGFFGQLAFQTSNFMGRGESLTVSLQGGERAQNFQVGFTEPFLFDRNITGGVDVHKRSLQYIGYYTQKSTGGNVTFGVPVGIFSRMFFNYSYETISITDLNEALIDNSCLLTGSCSTISNLNDLASTLTDAQLVQVQRNPFVADALLLPQGGKRTISKVVPTFLHNTVDHPIFPTQGKKYTAAVDLAVLGGNTQFLKPRLEGIWFFKHTSRTQLGLRGQFEYIAPVRKTTELLLPTFERLFLGGEYSVRGFDIRSIGPTIEGSPVVLGGNKSLLFNAEYSFTIAGPVRLLAFYDAGQVRDFGESFGWYEDVTRLVFPTPPPLVGPFGNIVQPLNAPTTTTEVIGKTSAFKTSTGIELRFFMPVLNVPFRLIYAWNPQRVGVLDNDLQPAKDQTFKFSVGTTF